jgi:hypothetical protein
VRIHGKGGTVRTVLPDDRGYLALLRLYLARTGYTAGPLFRASINGAGGPLSYDAAHHRWEGYCTAARLDIDIHQLLHAHATELINSGVSIEAVRQGCWTTRSPTPRCAPPAVAGSARRADRRQDWPTGRSARPSSRGPGRNCAGMLMLMRVLALAVEGLGCPAGEGEHCQDLAGGARVGAGGADRDLTKPASNGATPRSARRPREEG